MKDKFQKTLQPIFQLLLVAVLFFTQHFALLHELEHEQTLAGNESCVVCVIAHDDKLGLAPTALSLIIVSILVTYAFYAYRASPFLNLHKLLAQTRAPPSLT